MSSLNLLEINPEQLFIECTIPEIQEIDKKIQAEIEKKRQELRSMVSERYRDVLTAADTIKSMQKSATSLRAHIHQINRKCYEIHASTREEEPQLVPVNKETDFFRSIAIQIKILILIPEIIWTCLDAANYLKAVQIYLLAIHIHTGLELDTEHKVLEKFPLLTKLKLSVSLFRNRILQGIKRSLKDVKLSAQETSDHLCAYILLASKTQENALTFFVELRHTSLNSLLNSEVTLHSAVKCKVLDLIHCLMCTINLLYSCFVAGNENCEENEIVKTRLKDVLSEDGDSIIKKLELEETPLLDYIPLIVREFKPKCMEYEVELSSDVVKKVINDWLESTRSTLCLKLSKSLEHVMSVKVLHNIREEALKIEPPKHLNAACLENYLPKQFKVWHNLFQPLISKRAEELVCRKIQSNLQTIFEKISKEVKNWEEAEEELRSYVWSESPDDVSKDSNNHEGLTMKTRGFSPKIVEFCRALDRTYSELLQDVGLYLYGKVDGAEQVEPQSEDGKNLEYYLREESSSSIDKLISHVEKAVEKTNNKSVLVAARLFEAVSHLCPSLKKCCCAPDDEQPWSRVVEKLMAHSLKFWDYWLEAIESHIEEMANSYLIQDITFDNILHVLPKWDTIEIEEQTEDKIITSEIHLPTQPSISLVTLFSAVLTELNSVVPHTIPKTVHDKFIDSLITIIFRHYEGWSVHESTNQNLAIQFLLDVKFITLICVRRDCKVLLTKSQEICDNLRSKVDPFDLDVFYPYLQSCIKRAVLQLHILFGCLLGSSNQLSNIGMLEQANVPTSDREPSILSFSTPQNEIWFPLLPVTAPTPKGLNVSSHAQTNRLSSASPATTQPTRSSPASSSTFVRSGAAALLADWFS